MNYCIFQGGWIFGKIQNSCNVKNYFAIKPLWIYNHLECGHANKNEEDVHSKVVFNSS